MYIGTSRLVYLRSVNVSRQCFSPTAAPRRAASNTRLHIVFIVSPVRHLFIHSRLSPRPRSPQRIRVVSSPRSPLLFFLHTCAHTFTVSLFLFSASPLYLRERHRCRGARGSSIARPETRRNDLQCDLWIHPLLPQSCGLKRKAERKKFAESERLNASLVARDKGSPASPLCPRSRIIDHPVINFCSRTEG